MGQAGGLDEGGVGLGDEDGGGLGDGGDGLGGGGGSDPCRPSARPPRSVHTVTAVTVSSLPRALRRWAASTRFFARTVVACPSRTRAAAVLAPGIAAFAAAITVLK